MEGGAGEDTGAECCLLQDEVRAGCRVEQGQETERGARPGDQYGETGTLVEAGRDGDQQEHKPEGAGCPAGRVDQAGDQQGRIEEDDREEIATITPPGQECDAKPGCHPKNNHREGEIGATIDSFRREERDEQMDERATEEGQDDREPHPAVEFVEGAIWLFGRCTARPMPREQASAKPSPYGDRHSQWHHPATLTRRCSQYRSPLYGEPCHIGLIATPPYVPFGGRDSRRIQRLAPCARREPLVCRYRTLSRATRRAARRYRVPGVRRSPAYPCGRCGRPCHRAGHSCSRRPCPARAGGHPGSASRSLRAS